MKKLDESEIIRIFQKKIGNAKFFAEDVEVFRINNVPLVAKVDTFVESTDLPPKMNWKDAARKSIVACISDFAAKGVKPKFSIISLNLPKSVSRKTVDNIASGLSEAAREFNFRILGGDTNEGKEIVIHVCMFGAKNGFVSRKGAKNDHLVCVTGNFGYTAAGLDILLKNKSQITKFARKSIKYVLRPKPKLDFGLKCKKYFSSAMDSSDGLSTTLNEMAKQSGKKFVINNIPVKDDVLQFAKKYKIEPQKLIFDGGEEYEIVFTIPKNQRTSVRKIAKSLKIPFIEIGYVTNGKGVFMKNDEKTIKIKDLGWRHFR